MRKVACLPGLLTGVATTAAKGQDATSMAPAVAGGEPLSTLMICTLAAAIIVVLAGYFVIRSRNSHAADDKHKDPSDPPNG